MRILLGVSEHVVGGPLILLLWVFVQLQALVSDVGTWIESGEPWKGLYIFFSLGIIF